MKHKHADLIIAWANGAQIQIRDDLDDIWLDTNSPSWVAEYQYRIKPEPKQDVIYWTRVNKWKDAFTGLTTSAGALANVEFIFDGETGELKSVRMLT